ncbi:MAG: hypothetical protein J7578_14195, partial [Chitinophagaceae bacterium]|nr:hypothetical protein [Chitinophagaceae bacterium]
MRFISRPLPTVFSFTKNPQLSVDGKVKELGKLITIYEDVWKSTVRYYEKTVDFVVRVTLKASSTLYGRVQF